MHEKIPAKKYLLSEYRLLMVNALKTSKYSEFLFYYRITLLHFPYYNFIISNDAYTHYLRGLYSALNGNIKEYKYRISNYCNISPSDRVHVNVI